MAQAITNHKRDYEAERLRRRLRQEFLPSITEVVKSIAVSCEGRTFKRADLIEAVANRIGYPADESISGAVSSSLRTLHEEGFVVPAKEHGY
jgi:hypothetical protein